MQEPTRIGSVWPIVIGFLYDAGVISEDVYRGHAALPPYVRNMVVRMSEVLILAYQEGLEAGRAENFAGFSDSLTLPPEPTPPSPLTSYLRDGCEGRDGFAQAA